MNCYNHKDKPAIAICKNCFKAICEDCAIPDENGFTCSEKCHQEVLACVSMTEKAKSMYGLKPGRPPFGTLFMLIGCVPFIIFGLLDLLKGRVIGLFPLSMGLIFLALGIVSYRNMKKTGIRN